ncbi:MAG: glycosyltransferase, partial [Bacteroidetes bacterium]|nr:glycosyltransferase [Bacteroidota bacterium]
MISIIIPVFQDEDTIDHVYERVTSASESWNEDYEVVMVDDGSTDRSLE